ncbi:YceI family protein [Hanstruepera ponticola]|uniref:YceI family protein n=1 Tax=Hanstruepera ponticola TaxID=2042995 RepID=UPI00177EFAF2|nr:YceI family protein [Hanstruepera ponticola]
MKFIKSLILIVFISATTSFVNAQTINTDKSEVKFKISGGGIFTVKGTFTGMKGDFNFNSSDVSGSSFDICIDSKTINTKNDKRDEHLRSADFFDVEKYETICYKSNTVTKTSDGYKTTGDLTIHGVTKTVTIPFTFKNNTFEGELEINRFDYNIGEDYGTFRVGETAEVTIICKVN